MFNRRTKRNYGFFLDDFDIKMFDIDEDQEFKDNILDFTYMWICS